MRVLLSSLLALGSLCFLACSSDPVSNEIHDTDAGDVGVDVAADTPNGDAADESPPADALVDAPVEATPDAGPTSCEEPCSTACASKQPVEGACAACVETVCGEYLQRADNAPGREELFECFDACETAGCPNECCGKYPVACAWEVALDMCTCGFPEDSCAANCKGSCEEEGLTQACGVCASQSPCSLETFEYLFAPNRLVHQDCVDTCASSSLTLDECLDRCEKDHPTAGAAYGAFLACVCEHD